jgi:uncharacterized OB-fold protein
VLKIVAMPGDRPLAPRVTRFTAKFWQALGEGRFLATRCGDCGRVSFPPKAHCPACLARDVHWLELSGRGRLYTASRIHVGPGRFAEELPYTVAVVDLDEGVRLVTRLLDAPDVLPLDERIQLVVTNYADGPLFAAQLETPDAMP